MTTIYLGGGMLDIGDQMRRAWDKNLSSEE